MDLGSDLREHRQGRSSAINAVYFAIAAIGLNVQFGYTGLLNFGQAAFMACGAYGLGMTASTSRSRFWWGILHRNRLLDRARPVDGHPDTAPACRLPRDRHDRHRRDHPALRPIGASSRTSSAAATASRTSPATFRQVGVDRRASSRPTNYGFWCVHVHRSSTLDADRRLGARRTVRHARLAADASPGSGAEGDPRGRGRGAQPRQERLQLQDAGADPRRRDRHVLGHDLRPRPRLRAARQLQPRPDVLHPHRARARWRGQGVTARSSGRCCSGRSSRSSTTCCASSPSDGPVQIGDFTLIDLDPGRARSRSC